MNNQPTLVPNVFDPELITVTPAAAERIQAMVNKQGHGIGIRFGVKEKGCNGYKYFIEVIDNKQDNDRVFTINAKLAVYVDPESFSVIKGTEIDYVKQSAWRENFKFNNPNEKTSCGCGESFGVK